MSRLQVSAVMAFAVWSIVEAGGRSVLALTASGQSRDTEFRRVLQERKQQLDARRAQLERQRADLLQKRRAIVSTKSDLDAAVARLDAEKRRARKWICNAYNVAHNAPNECSKPEDGGRWITQPVATTGAEQAVRDLQQTLAEQGREYDEMLAIYEGAAKQLESDATQLGTEINQIVPVAQLTTRLQGAIEANKTDCANSVAAFAGSFGISNLTGLRARQQIDLMKRNWSELTPQEAQARANLGKPVFAGRMEDGNDHVAIVVPGKVDDRFGHPKLAGGSYQSANPAEPGAAYSAEGKTVNYIWNLKKAKLEEIKYYAPRDD